MDFYTVDTGYVKALNQTDSEVFYDSNYEQKPYVGMVIVANGYNYFIPLTSAKSKHRKWKNVNCDNYLIYEIIKVSRSIPKNWVYTINPSTNDVKHILAVLDIKKMIPVPTRLCNKIQFNSITDKEYRALLLKEYYFLKPLFPTIQTKAQKLYNYQINTGIVKTYYCNFKLLESICDTYK